MNINNLSNNISYKGLKFNGGLAKNYIKQDRMLDLFIKTAQIDTGSNPDNYSKTTPTTKGQIELATLLKEELDKMGLEDVELDEKGFLTAKLKANVDNAPTVGLLAHLDTSSQSITSNVRPIVHEYKGGDIKLKNNQIIEEEELKPFVGSTIITSDGTSLLGADDKAGIVEIIEALKVFLEHPELKRPNIKIAFTPDEEGAGGIDFFDVEKFNADVAYTIDGTMPEIIDTETFNAYNPEITIKGKSVHYGFAYGKMINSLLIASDFINSLPKNQTPETTKDKEGYFVVTQISGNVEETKIKMSIRDFDDGNAKERIKFVKEKLSELKEKYKGSEIEFNENPSYKNMKNYFCDKKEVVDYAKMGIKASGLEPKENYVRGGTDGSNLTIRGLPCPNLGAGGINFHSLREFISLDVMKKCTENIINICQVFALEDNVFKK